MITTGATTTGSFSAVRRLVVMLGLAVVIWLGLASPASAHAELVSTSPTPGAVVPTSPAQIVLTFSEQVDPVANSIRIVSGDGKEIEVAPANRGQGNHMLWVDVPKLADGTYVVAWKAVSADSHPVGGAFTFSVGAASDTRPGLVEELLSAGKPAQGPELWLGLGRWASFLGAGVLVGGLTVLAGRARPLLASPRATALLLAAAGTAVAGTLLMIGAQAALTEGSSTAWGAVASTSAGRWWFVRVGLLLIAAALVPLRRRLGSAAGPPLALLLSVALLAAIVAGGHGVSGHLVPLGFLATMVHLAAMSVWVGGLAALVLVVPRGSIVATAYRFSPIALWSVVALAASGVANAWRQSGSWSDLTHSSYGSWLIAKLVVVALVLAIAATSRWLVRAPTTATTDRAVQHTVVAEALGLLLVFAATAGLVSSPPPRQPALGPVSVNVVQGDRIAQLVLDPPVTGGTVMHVYVSSSSGSFEQPQSVTVTASLPDRQLGPLTIPTTTDGPGHVTSTDAVLPLPGTWTFAIIVRYSQFEQVTFNAQVNVR